MRLAALLVVCCACGTYSHLRPADNLRSGHVEINAGFAASTLPEVVPVAQAAVGITDWLELEAQYEVYSAFGELRVGILRSETSTVALSVGVGGGTASVWQDLGGDDNFRDGAVLGDVVVGKQWESIELYLSDRALILVSSGYVINAVKAGVRFRFRGLHLGLEGGVTTHHSFIALGEGTAFVGFSL